MVRICLLGERLQGVPLQLFGFVVQHDAHKHHDGAHCREQRDGVTEHDNAQPDGQSVLHRARHTDKQTQEKNYSALCMNAFTL